MKQNKFWTFEEISGPHFKLFKFTTLLPFEGKTFDFIGTKILSIYWLIIILIYDTMWLGYGVRMLAQKRFEIDYICEQIVVENLSLRYVLFFFKRKTFLKLIELCKELWSFLMPDETKIMRIYERRVYYFWNIVMTNVFIIVTTFIITSQFIRLPPTEINGTQLRMLPFRFYVDVQEEPTFTIVSIFQGVVTYSIMVIATIIEAAPLYIVLFGCGYLRSLKIRLMALTEHQDRVDHKYIENNMFYSEILECVRFHQKILVYCEKIENFMRTIYLVAIFTTVYNTSMLGLSIIQTKQQSVKYFALLVLNIFQFFTCQWSPDYLLSESGTIAHAAYFASLKQLGQQKKTNELLQFLIMRSQKPIQLTAGGYLKLSMETFGAMVKNAFSFSTLLRNFTI